MQLTAMHPFSSVLSLFLLLFLAPFPILSYIWTIEDMSSRFMASRSGLPAGNSPSESEFDNEISFLVKLTEDAFADVTNHMECKATWPYNGRLDGWHTCTSNTTSDDLRWSDQLFKWQLADDLYNTPGHFALRVVYPQTVDG